MTETSRVPRPGAAPAAAVARHTRVLLVEDDEGDAFLVRELLLDAGSDVQIERVRTVAEAGLVLPGDHDCVLLDLGLPDAQGLDALAAVLSSAPRLAVIVLTGLADEHRGTEAVAAGAQDYLVKGTIDGQLLTRSIRYAVERKRADESVRRLYETEARAAENQRLERGLLPRPLVSSDVSVTRQYQPGGAEAVLGGDFFDVVERADGALFAVIGDVAGHGPDEAALGVCLRIAWRTLVLSGVAPEQVLPALDNVLVSERASDEVFATVSMVRVDPARRTARFWLAGHPMPVVVDDGELRPVPDEAAGLALGIVSGVDWTGVDILLRPGSRVLMFTDGLIEGYDGQGGRQRLAEPGLHAIVLELLDRGLAGDDLVHALLGEVQDRNGGALTDDVAILLLSWAASG